MTPKLRDEMMILKGQIEAIKFPILWKDNANNQAYYDLIDSISNQYDAILKQLCEGYRND